MDAKQGPPMKQPQPILRARPRYGVPPLGGSSVVPRVAQAGGLLCRRLATCEWCDGLPTASRRHSRLPACATRDGACPKSWTPNRFFKQAHGVLPAFAFLTIFHPANLLACSACYGQSDSPMAKGMNWGIFSLLAVIGIMLGTIAAFAFYFAKRAAAVAANGATGEFLASNLSQPPRG